jgi:hypothetical protein
MLALVLAVASFPFWFVLHVVVSLRQVSLKLLYGQDATSFMLTMASSQDTLTITGKDIWNASPLAGMGMWIPSGTWSGMMSPTHVLGGGRW